MITLGLTGTVDRIEGDITFCSITDDAGNRGRATFDTSATVRAGIGIGDRFRFIYETGCLERLTNGNEG